MKTKNKSKTNKPYKDKKVLYKNLVEENKTYVQIAEDMGCHATTVRKWAIKFGIERKFEKKYLVDFPDLYREWDFTKNKEYDINKITHGSNARVWWICSNNSEHIWKTPVKERTTNQTGCPYCSGNRVSDLNSLSNNLPHLLKDWDYSKNKILPSDISIGSERLCFWKCSECGYECTSTIKTRNSLKSDCVKCSGRIVNETNNLAFMFPLLAEEFDLSKNSITPEQVSYGSNKKYWWKCPNGHSSYKTAVKSRTGINKTGCPKCASVKGTSYPEQAIYFYLKTVFPEVKSGKIFKIEEEGFEADIYIPVLNLIVEYDGVYWHKDKQQFDEYKSKVFVNEGKSVIRVLEKGLKPVKYCTIFFIESYYENHLNDVIKKVFHHILNSYQNKLTKEQLITMSEVVIDHKKDREKINSLFK